ncbi:outer membrane protein ompU [Vibrio ishigakensis]|uniref:Outer membrane protein ompU n=1 Tax=Vibrio ishigakensis TaxID=1481914 RepID=A0A0B8P637_9VIBR|nr:outer membrane protein ompU [Vibrio ishigakensis]
MKKLTLTAIAVASAFAASANAAEVYNADNLALSVGGRVEARTELSDKGKDDVLKADKREGQDDISRARINIDAKTNITDSVFAHGFFEKEFRKDAANGDNDTRYLFVGIGNENNELQYGKTDGSLGLITDYTDILNTYGAEASSKSATADRADNQLLYIGNYGDLTVKANFNGGGAAVSKSFFDDNGVKVPNKDINSTIDKGYGAAASYDFGMFKLGAGYANETHTGNAKDSDNILVGLGSNVTDALYLSALYVNGSQLGDDFQGYELAGSYAFTEKLTLASTFTSANFDSEKDDRNQAALDLGYQFTSYFKTYAGISKKFTQDEELKGMLGAKVTF